MKKNQHTSVDLMEFSQVQVHYSLEIIYPFVKSSLTTTKKTPKNTTRDSKGVLEYKLSACKWPDQYHSHISCNE